MSSIDVRKCGRCGDLYDPTEKHSNGGMDRKYGMVCKPCKVTLLEEMKTLYLSKVKKAK